MLSHGDWNFSKKCPEPEIFRSECSNIFSAPKKLKNQLHQKKLSNCKISKSNLNLALDGYFFLPKIIFKPSMAQTWFLKNCDTLQNQATPRTP
jgi:hypothetical protein